MSEQVMKQSNIKTIPLWKASVVFLVWVLLLGSTGLFVGTRYFWSGVDYRQIEREVTYYRQLVEMEPDKPEHRVALGFNLHRLGDLQGAMTQFQEAIDIDDQFYDAYLNRGYVYKDMGYWDDALADFEKCVEISPEDYKGHFNLGIVYRELDMTDASFEALGKALDLRPGATDILYHHALTAEKAGDTEGAIHFLERTLAFDPKYKDALDLYKKLSN